MLNQQYKHEINEIMDSKVYCNGIKSTNSRTISSFIDALNIMKEFNQV